MISLSFYLSQKLVRIEQINTTYTFHKIFKQVQDLRNLADCAKKQINVRTIEITAVTQKPITFLFHKTNNDHKKEFNVTLRNELEDY